MENTKRKRLTAVTIQGGIIQLIEENGSMGYYAQRGLSKLSEADKCYAIESRMINPKAFSLKELPSNYSISYECPEVQGKAVATFNLAKEMKKRSE